MCVPMPAVCSSITLGHCNKMFSFWPSARMQLWESPVAIKLCPHAILGIPNWNNYCTRVQKTTSFLLLPNNNNNNNPPARTTAGESTQPETKDFIGVALLRSLYVGLRVRVAPCPRPCRCLCPVFPYAPFHAQKRSAQPFLTFQQSLLLLRVHFLSLSFPTTQVCAARNSVRVLVCNDGVVCAIPRHTVIYQAVRSEVLRLRESN